MSVQRQPPPALESAIRARSGKQTGEEIRFCCPFPDRHRNGDSSPSARYNLAKRVWRCDVCNGSGGWIDLCGLLDIPLERSKERRACRVAVYVYKNEEGIALRRKVRWEPGFNGQTKSFSWEKPDNAGNWIKTSGDGNPRILYGSEKLLEARRSHRRIMVVEGEKDCETGNRLGLVTVCNPEGAAQSSQRPKWQQAYSQQLVDLFVTIIVDKDAPGRAHGKAVAQGLDGMAASVALLELPGDRVKDLTDWVEEKRLAGVTDTDIRRELEELSSEADASSCSDEAELATEREQNHQKSTQAQQLIRLAASAQLFHSPDQRAFASIRVRDHEETWPIRSRSFRNWLLRQYFETTGGAPNAQAVKDTLDLLEARAQFDGSEAPLPTRIATLNGALYIDLADTQWGSVEITADGWRIISECPVKFLRNKGMRPLARPEEGGCVLELAGFINVSEESDLQLIVAWLLAALRPQGPFPILVLQGEQGSAKSTTARILRSLVDPATAPIRTMPRDEHDLMIAARNSWLLAFDNLSSIPIWLSDALCRLATGGGFSTRQLYTDTEETIFEAQRPIVLNGIDELTSRQDLLDRSVVVHLPPIPQKARRPESELWEEFEAAKSKILGALLTAVCTGLRCLSDVRLPSLPRMADFAKWVTATESALPWPEGFFLRAYAGNREDSVGVALESDLVATALLAQMADQVYWEGTATELLAELEKHTSERTRRSRAWPTGARALSGRLRRAATFLRTVGVEVEFSHEMGTGSRRLIKVRKDGEFCVATVATVADLSEDSRIPEPELATQSGDATQVATQTDSRQCPDDGRCDGCDGCDAKTQDFSSWDERRSANEHPRAHLMQVAAVAGCPADVHRTPSREEIPREVVDL